MHFLKPLYIISIGIAFFVSLISFKRKFSFHLRFFSVLLVLTLITDIAAAYGITLLNYNANSPVYNSFMPIEFCAYSYFFQQIYKHKKAIDFGRYILLILPVCWLDSAVLVFGFKKW